MGIYIPGIEMPKGHNYVTITIWPSGTASYGLFDREENLRNYKAIKTIHVPEHGGLIDLKAPFEAQYYDDMTEEWIEKTVTVEDALYGCMVSDMPPVIIPADEGE